MPPQRRRRDDEFLHVATCQLGRGRRGFHPPSIDRSSSAFCAGERSRQENFYMSKPRIRRIRVSRAGTCDIHRVGGEEIVSRIAPRCIRLLSFPWQQSALRRLDAFLLRTRGSGSKLACLPSWNFIHTLSLLSFLN